MYPFRKPRHWSKPALSEPDGGGADHHNEGGAPMRGAQQATAPASVRETALPTLDRIEDERLYTGKDVDRLLNGLISHRSLERYRSKGHGGGPPYIKLGERKRCRVAYLGRDIKAWLLQGRRAG